MDRIILSLDGWNFSHLILTVVKLKSNQMDHEGQDLSVLQSLLNALNKISISSKDKNGEFG